MLGIVHVLEYTQRVNYSTRNTSQGKPGTTRRSSGDRAILARMARASSSGILSVAKAAAALRLDRRQAALKLAGFARRGWLVRARRGLYLLLPLEAEPGKPSVAEDPWILAREAFAPCYIGGWSAAEHWGLTEQLFRSTLVVTGASVRAKTARLLGHEFRLFRVPRPRIDGAVLVWRGSERVAVSDRERTIVDGLRQPAICGGLRHVAQMMSAYGEAKERDFDKLIVTAKKHGSGAAWKRLGYLAEVLWPDETRLAEEARRRITKGNARLDPAIKRPGRLLRRWGILVNVTVSGDEPKARA